MDFFMKSSISSSSFLAVLHQEYCSYLCSPSDIGSWWTPRSICYLKTALPRPFPALRPGNRPRLCSKYPIFHAMAPRPIFPLSYKLFRRLLFPSRGQLRSRWWSFWVFYWFSTFLHTKSAFRCRGRSVKLLPFFLILHPGWLLASVSFLCKARRLNVVSITMVLSDFGADGRLCFAIFGSPLVGAFDGAPIDFRCGADVAHAAGFVE